MFTMRGSVIPRVAGMCTACAVLGVMGLFAYEEYGFVFNDFLHKLVVMCAPLARARRERRAAAGPWLLSASPARVFSPNPPP